MPGIYQLGRRVGALMRKFAIPLTVVETTPIAEEFCAQWAVARAHRNPAPENPPLHQEDSFRLLPQHLYGPRSHPAKVPRP